MTPTEVAILVWLAIGIGIAAGVFLAARSAIQIASVAYRVIERQMDARTATREAGLLSVALVAALVVTAFVAGYAVLVVFASLLERSGVTGN